MEALKSRPSTDKGIKRFLEQSQLYSEAKSSSTKENESAFQN